jgi:hypothetical protein
MSNIKITKWYKEIDFVKRYQQICFNYYDFNNSLKGNRKSLYDEVLSDFDYSFKYYKSESFYRMEEQKDESLFILTLTLKDGLVDVMLNIKLNDKWCVPGGRLDFLAAELDRNFDREQYNLPKYDNTEELKDILNQIFEIYEDLKGKIEDVNPIPIPIRFVAEAVKLKRPSQEGSRPE